MSGCGRFSGIVMGFSGRIYNIIFHAKSQIKMIRKLKLTY